MSSRPPMPAPPYRGGCLCGQVRYSYNARPLGLNACHCKDCKVLSGSSHAEILLGLKEHFTHEQGEVQRYRKKADSGREIDIARCAHCGTRLWHEPLAAPAHLFMMAGTLDDSSWFVPTSHIWTAEAMAHIVMADDAFLLEGQPGDRQALYDAFDRAYPE